MLRCISNSDVSYGLEFTKNKGTLFLAIYLNRAITVIGAKVHFVGGLSSVTTVDIKNILSTEIGLLASGVILPKSSIRKLEAT